MNRSSTAGRPKRPVVRPRAMATRAKTASAAIANAATMVVVAATIGSMIGCGRASARQAGGEPAARAPAPTQPSTAQSSVDSTAQDEPASFPAGHWGTFHSHRFELSFALPDGRSWRIDDHRSPWLVATHDLTSSRLVVRAWLEPTFRTGTACYQKARSWDPALPNLDPSLAIEDETRTLKGGGNARIVVAVVPADAPHTVDAPDAPHAVDRPAAPGRRARSGASRLAGGFVALAGTAGRKCVVLVYRTEGASKEELGPKSSEVVLDRLAVIAHGTADSLAFDDPFAVPREAPAGSGSVPR